MATRPPQTSFPQVRPIEFLVRKNKLHIEKVKGEHSPPGPEGKCCKFCPVDIQGFCGRVSRINFGGGSFDCKSQYQVFF